jgi:hypothetical protein
MKTTIEFNNPKAMVIWLMEHEGKRLLRNKKEYKYFNRVFMYTKQGKSTTSMQVPRNLKDKIFTVK